VLLTDAFAKEVVLEKEGGKWVTKGVRFTRDGQDHVVRVEGEVIISGGSVQSPQLLEVSGIGNPEILNAAGIETKVENLNVGEHLQDHMSKCCCILAPALFCFRGS
jgi:choline dehydrogenase-like flavoprotein